MTRLPTALAAGIGGLTAVAAVVIARAGANAGTSYAGAGWAATFATLAAAFALFAAAPLARTNGAVVVAAGFCGLAPIAAAWIDGPPVLRAGATAAAAFTLPLLAHLALAAPRGRITGSTARAVIAGAYVWTAFSVVTLALVRDPFYDPRCWSDCDGNAFLVRSWPGLSDALVHARPWLQPAFGVLVVALAVPYLVQRAPAPRIAGFAAAAVGGAAILHGLALIAAPLEDPVDPTFLRVYFVTCLAAVLVGLALASSRVEIPLRCRAVRRVVAALDAAPAPDELERRLGAALGDPSLRIVFRLAETGRSVDTRGDDCARPLPAAGRAVTPLTRRGRTMAWIDHDLRAIGALEPALSPAVRLSIDNARLRAGLLAQVRDLRAARRRIVAEGDDERRRLERDLHDGIQQQLLVLASELRAAGRAARRREDPTADALERSLDETTALLEEVRSVAHGIFPAILGDAGLAAALASLADVAALPVELVCEPELRYPPPVEATAYRVVAEAIENAVQHSGATLVTAEVDEDSEVLVVRVHDDGRGGAAAEHVGGLAELVDRVGAIDGTLSIASGAGSGTTVAAVIPCVW